MGLFDNKETYVSSVVYNLAGEENDRPDYLKSLVVGNVLTASRFSMSDTIRDGYLGGPGIRLRSFGRWSQGEYAQVMGAVGSILSDPNAVDVEELEQQIPIPAGHGITIQRATLDRGDASWWAEDWMLQNFPNEIATDWTFIVNEMNQLVITRVGEAPVTLPLADYDTKSFYIYALYSTHEDIEHPPVVDPETEEVTPGYTETVFSDAKVFIYKIGSGNAVLDDMIGQDNEDGFYYPPIPVRVNNFFIGPDKDKWAPKDLPEDATEEEVEEAFKALKAAHPVGTLDSFFPTLYPLVKTAVRRSMGTRYDNIATIIAKNANLDDIDYAYITFGVPLNTKERASLQYLWDLFHRLYDVQGPLDHELWLAQLAEYGEKIAVWRAWKEAGSVGPEPAKPRIPPTRYGDISVQAQGTGSSSFQINYETQVRWKAMALSSGSGLGKAGAKKGDLWWVVEPEIEYTEYVYNEGVNFEETRGLPSVTLYRQMTDDSWEAITIFQLEHRNWVYNGKDIFTRAEAAIQDTSGDSGFIIPLHYDTFTSMSLIDSTQMATACCYMVLNCYEVVKKKWYQTFVFKVFLIVAMVVFTVVTGGLGAGGSGLLGSNVGVGTALGFTGTAAIIVGGIANAVAAMLVAKALGYVSVELFGEKLGTIIAAIATMVAMSVGTGMMNGQTFSTSFANMARADNLLNLTNSVGRGYAGFLEASAREIGQKTEDMLSEYEKKSQAVTDAYAANIGHGRGVIDPGTFVGVEPVFVETVDQFLARTLMTGSEIADFSTSLISNFTSLTLSTELP